MFAELKFYVCWNILKFGEKWTHAPHAINNSRMIRFIAEVQTNSALNMNLIILFFLIKFEMFGIGMWIWAKNVPKT